MRQQAIDGFCEIFGTTAEGLRVFFAPGRVNLIGEHTDYNGGHVLPCALNLGTYVAILPRDDKKVRLSSANFQPIVEVHLDSLNLDRAHGWANYPKIVAGLMKKAGDVKGFDMHIIGDLPNGAGLSSSASLNMATAFALNSVFNIGLSGIELAQLCQKTEALNGVNCGIMDPFASAMGKMNHAILLNCSTLEYSYVPLELGDYRIVIANTNKRRELADSSYNKRREECETALVDLRKVPGLEFLNDLCKLTPQEFDMHKNAIENRIIRGRAEHVVNENHRTQEAARYLSENNWTEASFLMQDSHRSLDDLYEVSCFELNELVYFGSMYGGNGNIPVVFGSRMTGAGFGGCTVNFVHNDFIEGFTEFVNKKYNFSTGRTADFYVVMPWDGANEVR